MEGMVENLMKNLIGTGGTSSNSDSGLNSTHFLSHSSNSSGMSPHTLQAALQALLSSNGQSSSNSNAASIIARNSSALDFSKANKTAWSDTTESSPRVDKVQDSDGSDEKSDEEEYIGGEIFPPEAAQKASSLSNFPKPNSSTVNHNDKSENAQPQPNLITNQLLQTLAQLTQKEPENRQDSMNGILSLLMSSQSPSSPIVERSQTLPDLATIQALNSLLNPPRSSMTESNSSPLENAAKLLNQLQILNELNALRSPMYNGNQNNDRAKLELISKLLGSPAPQPDPSSKVKDLVNLLGSVIDKEERRPSPQIKRPINHHNDHSLQTKKMKLSENGYSLESAAAKSFGVDKHNISVGEMGNKTIRQKMDDEMRAMLSSIVDENRGQTLWQIRQQLEERLPGKPSISLSTISRHMTRMTAAACAASGKPFFKNGNGGRKPTNPNLAGAPKNNFNNRSHTSAMNPPTKSNMIMSTNTCPPQTSSSDMMMLQNLQAVANRLLMTNQMNNNHQLGGQLPNHPTTHMFNARTNESGSAVTSSPTSNEDYLNVDTISHSSSPSNRQASQILEDKKEEEK